MKRQATKATGAKLNSTMRAGFLGAGAVLALHFFGCSSDKGNGTTPLTPGGAVCGNGMVETGEACDGMVSMTCAMATMNATATGTVVCTNCQIDSRGCQAVAATGGTPPVSGSGGSTVGTGASGGIVLGGGGSSSGGFVGSGGASSGGLVATGGTVPSGGASNGGASSGGASAGGTSGGANMGGSSGVLGDVNALRQACVDTINMYRATKNLPALTRATATVETCSDDGAKSDATAMVAHQSAGKCPGMGAQDTCPGWPPGQYGGAVGAIKNCLMSMWGEGEPPEGRTKCINDYFAGNIACFEMYGHYLNMSDTGNTVASCGFYVMPDGRLWMNQDLGR